MTSRGLVIEILLVPAWRRHTVLQEGLLLRLMMSGLGRDRLLGDQVISSDWHIARVHEHIGHEARHASRRGARLFGMLSMLAFLIAISCTAFQELHELRLGCIWLSLGLVLLRRPASFHRRLLSDLLEAASVRLLHVLLMADHLSVRVMALLTR